MKTYTHKFTTTEGKVFEFKTTNYYLNTVFDSNTRKVYYTESGHYQIPEHIVMAVEIIANPEEPTV